MNDQSVWTVSRMVTGPASDGGAVRVPTLETKDPTTGAVTDVAKDNDSKAKMFYTLFFPPKPTEDHVPPDAEYPQPKWKYAPVTDEQIGRAIAKMRPYKGTRPGTIPNCVFKNTKEILTMHLGPIYRATDTFQWYPDDWKITSTPVIRKPGRTDYTAPGAWRPVVLSSGHARLLNSSKTDDIVMQCERMGILPAMHFGGRPGRSTTDSVHLLVQTVKDAWRKGMVVSVLFLDVKGAFPSVDTRRLAHNMRMMGIPKEHAEWMMRRLTGRKTTLTFDNLQSGEFDIDNGLDQGDPLSGITYILYNSGFLLCLKPERGERGALFIDDAYILVIGHSFEETHAKLEDVMVRPGGVFEWAKIHNCEFGLDKFQLMDLSRKRVPHPALPRRKIPLPRPDLKLQTHLIKSKDYATFLGVRIDRELRWKEHGAHTIAKGQAWTAQMARIARVSRGVATPYLRRLYTAVALPKIMYAADIFLNPATSRKRGDRNGRGGKAVINRLVSIQ
jgi:hypothetical protein